MEVPVLVLPRKTAGLQGSPEVFGAPKMFPLVSLSDALADQYDYDAHVVAYRVLGEDRCPRINKTGYQYLTDNGGEVVAEIVLVDVDNPGHATWHSLDEIEETFQRVRSTVIGKNAGFYATRHGYRLFWRLDKPVDVRFFESLTKQLVVRLRFEGIEADESCTDWTRLFRLPHATPEGDGRPIGLPAYLDHGVLDFHPPLTESKMPSIASGVGEGWRSDHPDVLPPTVEGCELLKSDAELFRRVSRGLPLSDPGGRQNALQRAVGIIAKRHPDPQPENVFAVIGYSVAIDKHDTAENGPPPSLQAAWEACKRTCAKELSERAAEQRVLDGIALVAARRQVQRRGQEATAAVQEPSDEEGEDGASAVGAGQAEPEEDDAVFDDVDEWRNGRFGKTIPDLKKAVLFTNARTYYVRQEARSLATLNTPNPMVCYVGPCEGTGLPAMLETYAPAALARGGGIRNPKTGMLVSVPEILTRFGTEVERVVAVIGKSGIEFDEKNRIVEEGVAAIRSDLRPKFDPLIHRWLTIFGGAYADKLFDWLATFTDLSNPTCGLYLRSTGGTGKGLLASGLARLWGASPTMYGNIVGTHNDGIAVCPLIWADEEIPPSQYGKTPSAVFRTLVGNSEFNLRRMYSAAATIRGCLRLLVTANNDNALKIEENLTPDDYEAIVQRIGYIRVPDAAKTYLEAIGGRKTTRAWVEGDGIARHVLWLKQNRTVVPGKRFLVDGWESELHKSLQSTSGAAEAVVLVVAHAVARKIAAAGVGGAGAAAFPQFQLGNNHVYVTIDGVFDLWDTVLGARSKPASKPSIRAALRQLATTGGPVRVEASNGVKQQTFSMWPIRPKEIVEAIEQYGLGDAQVAADAIANGVLRVR